MPALILCYALGDAAIARRLGESIEANFAWEVSYKEGLIAEGSDLIDSAERGLSAEVCLVLLSPHSVPQAWTRERWEPVLLDGPKEFGMVMGFVLLDACRFPELLRRQPFFDLTRDWMEGARQIRRWLLRPEAGRPAESRIPDDLSVLSEQLVDRPGSAESIPHEDARRLTRTCALDFESAHFFDCGGRSRAGILGDIGHSIGLPLPGTVAENRTELIDHCALHRYLFVYGNAGAADRDFIRTGGRTSVIFADDAPRDDARTTAEVAAVFLATPRDPNACARLLGCAVKRMKELLCDDTEFGLRLGWAIITVLGTARRFAEKVEVLDEMERAAAVRNDGFSLWRIQWEQSWSAETAEPGESARMLPTAGPETTQLTLEFC